MRRAVLLAVLAASVSPAEACQFPQVLIRHLGECVAPRSKLALAYVPFARDPMRWRFRHTIPDQHKFKDPIVVPMPDPAPKAPPAVERATAIEPLKPIHPLYWPVPLPDLEAGMPPSWRICIEHHDWCHNEGTQPNDR
jgi:hypothetical protein